MSKPSIELSLTTLADGHVWPRYELAQHKQFRKQWALWRAEGTTYKPVAYFRDPFEADAFAAFLYEVATRAGARITEDPLS